MGNHTIYYAVEYRCDVFVFGILEITVDAVLPSITAVINSTSQGACSPTFNFNGSVTGNTNNIVSHFWDFGDGTSDTQNPINHEFSGSGTYNVTYIATDECNNTGFATVPVTVSSGQSDPLIAAFVVEHL